jgi:sugar phosphate isomerase/epimerase
MTTLSRRRFLSTSTLALLGAPLLRAVEPFVHVGGPRLRLGLAAYSFRDQFQKGQPPLTFEKFLDHCAEWGVEGAELTSYYFPKDVTDAQLVAVKRHAHLRGISVTGTSVGNTFTHPPGKERDKEIADVKLWIDRAVVLGAPHVRVFAGNVPKGGNLADAKKTCIEQLEECAEYAGKRGVFLGIENHGGIVAEPKELLEIVQAVKSPWVGINLDTGNFHTADPYADLAKIAPYAVNVQIKVEMRPKGAKENQPADLARVVGLLRDASYQGWVTLEYEAKEDPWKAVPEHLATLKQLLSGKAAPAAGQGWQPLFDGKGLGKWQETDFAGRSTVEVKDGQLILNAGGDLTGVHRADFPAKMDYEVEFQAMRVEGDDFFCGFTFPVGETHVTFVAGGWGGTVTGISDINSESAIDNETNQSKNYENGRWYRVRVRVTKPKIEVWMDKEQMVDLETEGKTLAMRAGEIEISKPFGFATFRTKAALKDIQWRKL